MEPERFAILRNATELFCGKLLRVTDAGMATIVAIPALDLLLAGDGPCCNRISRPASMLSVFDDRSAMLDAARTIYRKETDGQD